MKSNLLFPRVGTLFPNPFGPGFATTSVAEQVQFWGGDETGLCPGKGNSRNSDGQKCVIYAHY